MVKNQSVIPLEIRVIFDISSYQLMIKQAGESSSIVSGDFVSSRRGRTIDKLRELNEYIESMVADLGDSKVYKLPESGFALNVSYECVEDIKNPEVSLSLR